jgi:hypothetical protein
MKGPIIGIVIVLALLGAGAIFFAESAFNPAPPASLEQLYANELFGISFSYPVGYVLAEAEVGVLGRTHHVITIIAEADAIPRANSEGPTAITIDVYQNDTNPLTLSEWLATDESNLRLGSGETTAGMIQDTEVVQYAWSGLYEGETIAFLHNDRIIAVSVTYMSKSDPLYAVSQSLLDSLRLR